MTEEPKKQAHDSALGMNREISRRDFMNSTLLASGDALLAGSHRTSCWPNWAKRASPVTAARAITPNRMETLLK